MEALSWLNDKDDPSVEDAKVFIEKHPDALMGIVDDGDPQVPLHHAIRNRASDEVILLLLEACPQAAKEIVRGYNALYLAIDVGVGGNAMCSEEVIKALLNAHPGAASARNPHTQNLPLHDAVNKNASEGIILSLLNAYPQAAFVEMKDGRLLVEICLEKKASDDLMREICKVRVRVDGLLPLGVVLTKRSSDDIVLAVLEADPEAAGKRFSTNCDECILPLHMACEDNHSEPVKDAMRHAYPDAEKENPFETIYLLHKFLENEPLDQGGDDVENLIEKYPEAAGKRGRDGRLPLHIAIDRIASPEVTYQLFQAYRQAGKEKMVDGRLPIEVFAEQKVTDDWPQEYLTQMAKFLLENDMPVSIEDGTPVEHSYSWHACISYSNETATRAVRIVLLDSEKRDDDSEDLCGFGKHIHALADACDYQGRTALGLASKESREVIYEYLLFCGRYKLPVGPPEHRSQTSVVLRAQDLAEQVDYGVIFDEADDGNGKLDRKELSSIADSIGLNPGMFLKGSDAEESNESISKGEFVSICKRLLGDGHREVVIKLMKNKDQWEAECNAREDYDLDPKYVVSALPNVPSDTKIADAVRDSEGGLDIIRENYLDNIELGKYAFVMPAADRNLQQMFYQEQPKIENVRAMLRQVFEAVKHLHEKKLMHGDIKMLNIMRFRIDNGLRLIDLDASARIVPPGGEEESFAGAKFSSAILPPEMIERIEPGDVEAFKKYWESEIEEDLKKKVAPKLYQEPGKLKAHYVVKSFRTEEGMPVFEGLPYRLVRASENIDLWSLGVLAFTLLTGEMLIPSTRDDDCASGAAMHLLHSWGTQPEVLSDLFKKIEDNAACDLVWKLLQKEPGKRKTIEDLLKSHPFFHPQSVENALPRPAIFENLLFYGRYKFFDGPPEHRSQTSVVFRAQDLDKQADYSAIFDEADKDKNGNLDRQELEKIASSIGLNPELFLRGSDTTSKLIFVDVCKRQLGDGPREVVIKLMKNKDQWEREFDARKKYDLDPKFVVTAQPKIPPEDDSANAKEKGDGGLNIIVEKFLDGIEVGQHAVVMPAADRNLFQMFHQEQPNIDAVRDILRQVFEAVKHLHEQKLMHGDIKMANIVRFRIDNGLSLIDLDASARIVQQGEDDEKKTFAGSKFSSAILPPEMIEKIVTSKQLDEFNAYWESENDKDLKEKVTPKPYGEDGIEKARYVVKSFRTNEEGKPVKEGLPYKLERASENIDVWSLGVLAFTLLTGEALIPSTRDDDCASGAAMHLLKSWGTRSDVLIDRFKKIQNDAARDLVWNLLKQKPEERPTVASLLEEHPFFHSNMSAGTEDQFRAMKEFLQNLTNQVGILNATMLEVKKLSIESKKELFNTRHDLHRTRHVLLNGIFEATDVRTPTAFIILNKELPPAAEPTDEKVEKTLDIVTAEDGSGVSMNTKYVSVTLTAEGADMALEGDLKEHHDRFQDGLMWAKRMKDIGTNFATGDIDEAFKTIREGIDDLIVGNTIYLYLIDELTGKPVEAKGWPLIITTPSEKVPRLIPLMQVGMVAISICNGAAGLAKMFSIPAPIVPKAWSKGAQESIELLKQESSVQEFGIVHAKVKEGNEEAESVRGASLREFQDFLNKHDPGLKNGNIGHYAGLQRICDPEEGAALWTALTDKAAIESALKERATQREVEERKQNMHNRQEEMAESTLVTKEEISEVVDLSTVSSGGRNIDESRDTSKCVVTEKKRKLSGAKNAAAEERCAADEENISAPSAAVGSEETELAKGSKKATAASKGVSSTSAAGNVYQMNFCNDCCTIM